MKLLVTGATGFVGRRLIARLASEGHTVVATYRKEGTTDPVDGVTWYRMPNIGPSSDWKEALSGVEVVVHLAALAHQVGKSGEGRLAEFMATNAEGTAALARASVQAQSVRRFILISSIGAVASGSDAVLDENTECRPSTDYGRSKREGELKLARVLQPTSIDWCILRPPLVYGPANPGNMARLIGLIRKGLPLPFAGIRNQRSFIYVDNLVDAICVCTRDPRPLAGRTFFVTEGADLSTAELSVILAKHLGLRVRLLRIPATMLKALARVGDLGSMLLRRPIGIDSYSVERLIGSLRADGSRFREAFSWKPPFSTEEGIRATCAAALELQPKGEAQ